MRQGGAEEGRGQLTVEAGGRACVSDMKELEPDTFFRRVIVEAGPGDNMPARKNKLVATDKMRKVVLCSGQILPDVHARATRKVDDVLLVRIEQLAPFPFDRIAPMLALPPQLLDQFPCLLYLLVDPVPLQDGAAALQSRADSYAQPLRR